MNNSKQAAITLTAPVSHRGSGVNNVKRRDMANPHLINALNAINGSMDSANNDLTSNQKQGKKGADTTPRRS